MPVSVSRKQYRMMQAIAHGKIDPSKVKGGRGVPPKSVAEKYTDPGKDAPEQHGENRGGSWTEEHHKKHKEKHSKKKDVKKSFEDFYKANGLGKKKNAAATIVINSNGEILMGTHSDGGLAIPGGHMDDADMESFEITALRELKEEAGIVGRNPTKVWEGSSNGTHCKVYLVESFSGKPKGGDDLSNVKWISPEKIEWSKVRQCCVTSLKSFIEQKLGKSLKGMIALEALSKNIIRQKSDAVFEVTHGDALKLVGNGVFRFIREQVKGMGDEDFKDIKIDTHTISIRKHMNDVYSGRVSDGHKIVYQFTNKSLPELTAALMSVFEWYLPEDEKELEMLDDSMSDDIIHGGIQTLLDNYKKHNIGNIYEEMETIREQLRNGTAVDIQQVEAKIMKLFDKLEETVHMVASKHNELAQVSGKEIDEIENKLRELQYKLDVIEKKPETVEAFSAKPANPEKVHDEGYSYLAKPVIEISPNGKIKITFGSDWSDLDKSNFLTDLRAKAIKRKK